ncbi:hypothetical protein V8E54_013541 [Elaphomyces granulatus]
MNYPDLAPPTIMVWKAYRIGIITGTAEGGVKATLKTVLEDLQPAEGGDDFEPISVYDVYPFIYDGSMLTENGSMPNSGYDVNHFTDQTTVGVEVSFLAYHMSSLLTANGKITLSNWYLNMGLPLCIDYSSEESQATLNTSQLDAAMPTTIDCTDYELIEVLGPEADMINVWQSHDCPHYTLAIEVEEDIWEVVIPRSCIPALEDFFIETESIPT